MVVSAVDPNPLVHAQGVRRLEEAGLDVSVGLLAERNAALNEAFAKHIVRKVPFVTIKAALGLDGKIACADGRLEVDLLGRDARLRPPPPRRTGRHPDRLRHAPRRRPAPHRPPRPLAGEEAAAGGPRLPPALPRRGPAARDARPRPGPRLRRPERPGRPGPGPRGARRRGRLPRRRSGRLDARPASWPSSAGRGVVSLLVEGGSRVITSFVEAGLADKAVLTYAPRLLGGAAAPGPRRRRGRRLGRPGRAGSRGRARSRLADDIVVEGYF
ncbi:MAG: dihydrofolate reductase family protein [Comamonadaceae bacterium]|nr:dihydrofolate reductase family protein [Comamonadaceae bacterium]